MPTGEPISQEQWRGGVNKGLEALEQTVVDLAKADKDQDKQINENTLKIAVINAKTAIIAAVISTVGFILSILIPIVMWAFDKFMHHGS